MVYMETKFDIGETIWVPATIESVLIIKDDTNTIVKTYGIELKDSRGVLMHLRCDENDLARMMEVTVD